MLGGSQSKGVCAAFAALLAAHAFLFSYCAVRKSVCADEGGHLAAGLVYLRYGEFSLYDLSPPLMRMWDALPALACHPTLDDPKPLRVETPNARPWVYFERFQQENLHHLHNYVLMGRFMQLPLSIALAVGLFLVAKGMYGGWPAIVVMGAYCLNPAILATASTVGTDLGVSVALFFAIVAWLQFVRTQHKAPLLWCALAVGMAHAIKFNALLIWPVLAATALLSRRKANAFVGLVVVIIVSYVVLNLSYGFQLWGLPLHRFEFESQTMQSVQRLLPANLHLPLPKYLVEGFDAQKWEAEGAYFAVLFGKARSGGPLAYYPWLLLCTTPLAGLILLACCLGSFVQSRPDRRELAFLLLGATLVLGMVAFAKVNIGLRYVLPAYPPMLVLLGRLSRRWYAALIVVMAIEVGFAAPRFHAYRNVAALHARVPDRDEGQSLRELHEWMQKNSIDEITLLPWQMVDPAVEGIRVRPLTQPRTRWVAFSRSYLDGFPQHAGRQTLIVSNWRALAMTPPAVDLGGVVIFPAEAMGPDPWVKSYQSWAEALRDPCVVPIENHDK